MNTVQVSENNVTVLVNPKWYGSFYSTEDQTNAGATSVNKVTCNITDLSNGVTIVSNSRITIANAGTYNLQFSLQLDKSDSGTDNFDVWLCKNGQNVANTNTQFTLAGNSAKAVAALNLLVQAAAGDYFELCWHSDDTDVFLNYVAAGSSPTRPAIPSAIITVNQIA